MTCVACAGGEPGERFELCFGHASEFLSIVEPEPLLEDLGAHQVEPVEQAQLEAPAVDPLQEAEAAEAVTVVERPPCPVDGYPCESPTDAGCLPQSMGLCPKDEPKRPSDALARPSAREARILAYAEQLRAEGWEADAALESAREAYSDRGGHELKRKPVEMRGSPALLRQRLDIEAVARPGATYA